MSGSRGVCTGKNAESGCVGDWMHFFSNQKLNIFLIFFLSPVNSLPFLDSKRFFCSLRKKQLNVVHFTPWMELEMVTGDQEEG